MPVFLHRGIKMNIINFDFSKVDTSNQRRISSHEENKIITDILLGKMSYSDLFKQDNFTKENNNDVVDEFPMGVIA